MSREEAVFRAATASLILGLALWRRGSRVGQALISLGLGLGVALLLARAL